MLALICAPAVLLKVSVAPALAEILTAPESNVTCGLDAVAEVVSVVPSNVAVYVRLPPLIPPPAAMQSATNPLAGSTAACAVAKSMYGEAKTGISNAHEQSVGVVQHGIHGEVFVKMDGSNGFIIQQPNDMLIYLLPCRPKTPDSMPTSG